MNEWTRYLQPEPRALTVGDSFPNPKELALPRGELPAYFGEEIRQVPGLRLREGSDGFALRTRVDPAVGNPEGYRLTVDPDGIRVDGGSERGVAYGATTLLQYLHLHARAAALPRISVKDEPAFRTRCFMIDPGRSVFPLPLIRRILRMLASLKMNQLHLHIWDDELCGIRFPGHPFGSENPNAMSLDELGGIVQEAARYGIEIVPELEGWAHVGSLVWHRKELRGGDGMYNGSAFLIREEVFDLFRDLIGKTASVLPAKATIHMGLDEAKWYLDPSMPKGFTPADLVQRYHDIIEETGKRQGKDLTMRLWADHGGRPIPASIRGSVIVEPWQYWGAREKDIRKKVRRFSRGKERWIAGAGQSVAQPRGAYHATRQWCRDAAKSRNCEGINVTFWGQNDLAGRLMSLYAGSLFPWNPRPGQKALLAENYEDFDRGVFPLMEWWQTAFRDGRPDGINRDRGDYVYLGYRFWGDNHGKPVAPTVPIANTLFGHDFLHEG